MSNPYREYKTGFIDNLPVGITYNADIGRFYVNERRVTSPQKAEDYLKYLVKFGFIVDPTIKVFNGAVEYSDYTASANFTQELGFNANVSGVSTQASGDFDVVVSVTYDFDAAASYGNFQSSGDFEVEGAISFSSAVSHGSYSAVTDFNRELSFSSAATYVNYQSTNSFDVVVNNFTLTETVDGKLEINVETGTVTVTVTSPAVYANYDAGNGAGVFTFDSSEIASGPVNLVPPQITDDGTPTEGEQITIVPGLWVYDSDDNASEPSTSLIRLRDGTAAGTMTSPYTLLALDAGTFAVRETATGANGVRSADSASITVTAAGGWSITDNGDGTFDVASAPPAQAALTITDNGDGTFNVAA